MPWHNDNAKEWGALSARDLNPLYIYYKPKINSRTLQGDTDKAEARVATRGQGVQVNQYGQGAIGQETVTGESWVDVSIHGFWKCRISALFDMQIVNLYTGSYLRQMSTKSMATL